MGGFGTPRCYDLWCERDLVGTHGEWGRKTVAGSVRNILKKSLSADAK